MLVLKIKDVADKVDKETWTRVINKIAELLTRARSKILVTGRKVRVANKVSINQIKEEVKVDRIEETRADNKVVARKVRANLVM